MRDRKVNYFAKVTCLGRDRAGQLGSRACTVGHSAVVLFHSVSFHTCPCHHAAYSCTFITKRHCSNTVFPQIYCITRRSTDIHHLINCCVFRLTDCYLPALRALFSVWRAEVILSACSSFISVDHVYHFLHAVTVPVMS